ncbi:MAG: hypothetical protein GKC02_05610 [Methanomassiliicoccales archaeon]|nr:hypothetical protein [Methanomassiliicoccales archaeon]
MTGGYIKQLELTKQLEKQAKKAAANREAAEKKIEESEELIASAKRMGANAAGAEKLLVEASEAFSRKDYKGALSLAIKSIEVSGEAKANEIENIIKTTRELLSNMGELATDAKEPTAAIEQAVGLLEKGDLDDAYAEANIAWDVAERFINARMADEFERAQSLLLLAENENINTDSEREQLSQARRSLESGDFVESIDLLTSCLESVSDGLINLYHKRKLELQKGMEESKSVSIELSRVSDQIQKADERIAQADMEEGLSDLTIAEGEFRKSFSRALLKEFDSLESRLELLSRYEEEVSELGSPIARGRGLTRDGEYLNALEICRDVIDKVNENELNVLATQIYNLKPKLQIAKRTGNDTKKAIGLIEESKVTIQGGDFQGALDLIHQADIVLERELEGFREVEMELVKTENLMIRADRYGLDCSRAEDSMRSARTLALKAELGESVEQMKAAQKELDKEIQQYLGSEIMRAELMLASAMRMGSDVTKESAMIDDIMARVRSGDYTDVDDPLEKCRMYIREFLEINSEKTIDHARNLLEKYEGMANITSSRLMLEDAMSAFDGKDFDKAFKMANKAIQELEKQENAVLENQLNEARRLLEINKGLGAESATINERVAEAEALRLDGRTKEGILAASEVLQLAGSVVREHIRKGMNSLSRSISAARKKGVEILRVEKLAQRVSSSLENDQVADAYDILQEADEELRGLLNKHEEVSEYLQDIEGLIEEAKANGVDVNSSEQFLQQTRVLFDAGEYDKASELARKTLGEAESKTALLMAPRRIQEVKNLIATGKRLDLDVSKEEVELSKAQSLLDMGQHIQALASTKNIRRDMRDRIVQGLKGEISRAREMITRARELGADVSAIGNIVDRAEKLLGEDRVNDALRAVDLVKKELDQGLIIERKASEGIARASAVISNVRKAGMEPAGAVEILRQAKDQAQAGRGGIAMELAKKSADQAAETARTKLMERFKNLEITQRAMEVEGSDLNQANRMKSDFRKMLEEWKFTHALTLLDNLEEELERLDKQKKLATGTLEETRAKVTKAKDRGLISQKVEDLLDSAISRLEEGAYTAAFSDAIRCRDELRSLEELYDRRMGDLGKLRKRMEAASNEGVDISSVSGYFDEAERSLRQLDFEEASLNLSRGDTALGKKIENEMESRQQDMRALYRLYCDLGLNESDPLEKVVRQTEMKRLKPDEFKTLNQNLDQLREIIEKRMETTLGEISGRIQVASKSGADVSTSEYLLSQGRELLGTGNLNEAFFMIKEAEDSIGVAMDERREFMELKMRCESLIENARRNGLVMEWVISLVAKADGERKSDYKAAIETMKEALSRAEEEAASYLPELAIDINFLDPAASDQWMRARVVISNESKAMARDVRIELSGEIEVRGLESIKKLRSNESREIEFEIMPLRKGDIEVNFSLSCRPVLSEDTFGLESSFQLEAE